MVDFGYYAQEHESLHGGATLLEEMRLAAAEAPKRGGDLPGDGKLRSIPGRSSFSAASRRSNQSSHSPAGEKTRLALATLMVGGYNTLLLDEPTNNLDPQSREQVGEALRGFKGTLVIVSHDTEFVETWSLIWRCHCQSGRCATSMRAAWRRSPRIAAPPPGRNVNALAGPLIRELASALTHHGQTCEHERHETDLLPG